MIEFHPWHTSARATNCCALHLSVTTSHLTMIDTWNGVSPMAQSASMILAQRSYSACLNIFIPANSLLLSSLTAERLSLQAQTAQSRYGMLSRVIETRSIYKTQRCCLATRVRLLPSLHLVLCQHSYQHRQMAESTSGISTASNLCVSLISGPVRSATQSQFKQLRLTTLLEISCWLADLVSSSPRSTANYSLIRTFAMAMTATASLL